MAGGGLAAFSVADTRRARGAGRRVVNNLCVTKRVGAWNKRRAVNSKFVTLIWRWGVGGSGMSL